MVVVEELTLCDPIHEVAELKEDEVDISEILTAEISLFAEEGDQRLNLAQQSLGDCSSIPLSIARHRGGAFQIGDNLSDHLDLPDLRGAAAEKMRAILVCNKLHDRASVSQARLSINEVGQIGERQPHAVLLLEPA